MELVISFFRDTLNGPLYYIVLVLSVFFIFAIIGYLSEKKMKQIMEESKEYEALNRETLKMHRQDEQETTSSIPQESNQPPIRSIPIIEKTEKEDTNIGPKEQEATIADIANSNQTPTILDLDKVTINK